MKKMNTYLMYPNGPNIELPEGYYWNIDTQEVVANDLSWRGDLLAWWKFCHPST